jgi:hypothetical protein
LTKLALSERISSATNEIYCLVFLVRTAMWHMLNQEYTLTNTEQDLHDARALLEQAGTDEEKKKYRKAAEIILLKTLRLDPQNEEAKALLQSVRAVPVSHAAPHPPQRPQEDVPFVVVPPKVKSVHTDKKKEPKPKFILGLIATIGLGGGLLWILQPHWMSPNAVGASTVRTESVHQSNIPTPVADAAFPAAAIPEPAASSEQPLVSVAPPLIATPAQAGTPPAPGTTATATAAMGKLAVGSPTTAEIYQGSQYLGSAPTTLQLPVGRQTLEFRHGDLRTILSYDIKSDETTTASVTFQATVQINARPWAQVFLEGAPRRALGQTPLSGVSVPIGGVLVLENPNFTSKTHRITEKDTAIQVDFP